MKLVKIGQFWYTSHQGNLRRNDKLVEDIERWNVVSRVSQGEFDELKTEFGEVVKNIGIDPGATKVTAAGKDPHSPTGAHVKEIALEDPTTVAKFDSWHATVAGKKPS